MSVNAACYVMKKNHKKVLTRFGEFVINTILATKPTGGKIKVGKKH
jgi:hypothetical protein